MNVNKVLAMARIPSWSFDCHTGQTSYPPSPRPSYTLGHLCGGAVAVADPAAPFGDSHTSVTFLIYFLFLGSVKGPLIKHTICSTETFFGILIVSGLSHNTMNIKGGIFILF